MSYKSRIIFSKSVSRHIMPAMLVSVALLTSGCSTFSRFDFPVFGLTSDSEKNQRTGSLPDDSYQNYPPAGSDVRPYRPYNGAPYNNHRHGGYGNGNGNGGYENGSYNDSYSPSRYPSRLGYSNNAPRRYASNDRDVITRSDLPDNTVYDAPQQNAGYQNGGYNGYNDSYNSFNAPSERRGQRSSGQRVSGQRNTAPRNVTVRPLSGSGSSGREPYSNDRHEYEAAYQDYNQNVVPGAPYRADYNQPVEPHYSGSTRGTVTVQKGDTLYAIAKRNGVSVEQMRTANNLTGNSLHVGQKLTLPSYQTASYNDAVSERGGRSFDRPSGRADVFDAREAEAYTQNGGSRKRYVGGPGKRVYDTAQLRDIDQGQGPDRRVLGGKPREAEDLDDGQDPEDRTERQSSERQPSERQRLDGSGRPQDREIEKRTATERTATARDDAPAGQQPTLEKREAAKAEEKKVASLPEQPKAGEENIEMPSTSGRFRWPVRGRIISHFGGKENGAKNDGINISVPEGTEIKAAEGGVVAYAGNELKGYGKLILIRHEDNWVTAYAHSSEILVKRGDTVRRGQVIAKAGKTGAVSQPQVHFEVRRGSTPVDPLKYM